MSLAELERGCESTIENCAVRDSHDTSKHMDFDASQLNTAGHLTSLINDSPSILLRAANSLPCIRTSVLRCSASSCRKGIGLGLSARPLPPQRGVQAGNPKKRHRQPPATGPSLETSFYNSQTTTEQDHCSAPRSSPRHRHFKNPTVSTHHPSPASHHPPPPHTPTPSTQHPPPTI